MWKGNGRLVSGKWASKEWASSKWASKGNWALRKEKTREKRHFMTAALLFGRHYPQRGDFLTSKMISSDKPGCSDTRDWAMCPSCSSLVSNPVLRSPRSWIEIVLNCGNGNEIGVWHCDCHIQHISIIPATTQKLAPVEIPIVVTKCWTASIRDGLGQGQREQRREEQGSTLTEIAVMI